MTPVFELKDLHVTLRQHRHATELVKGVSFAVESGECLVSWESRAAENPCL